MRFFYKPFGIMFGLIAGLLSKRVFDFVWSRFDEEEPPKPTTLEATWPKVLGAAAVQGMTFKVTRAFVDRTGANSFRWLTGVWPGEKTPDPK